MSTKRWLVGCGIAVPLLCCLGGIGTFQGLFGTAAAKQAKEIDAARKAGIPVEPGELQAMIQVPDGQNAAPIYHELEISTKNDKAYKKAVDAAKKGLGLSATPEERAAMAQAVKDLAPVIAKLERAADLPGCDFHKDWAQGPALLFPELAEMKAWAQILTADALVRSDRGDWRGALKSIQRADRIAHQSGQIPILIGMLVQTAIEAVVNRAFDRIIQEHGHDAAFVPAARQTLASFGKLPDFRRSLMGEVVLGRTAIRSLNGMSDLEMGPEENHRRPSSLERAFFHSKTVQSAFDAKLLEVYRTYITRLPKDPAKWEEAVQVSQKIEREVEADHSVANLLNRVLFPVFDQAATAVGQNLMRRRLTETSLRLLDVRNRTGAFPRTLPDWGDSRIDPFTGKPFRYRHEGKGVLFFSVGRDRVDDDGAPRDLKNGSKTFDEVIRLQ